ncbi:MAG: sugar phosphate isomerase/epimerase [Caldilineaceae bacterium]|nr:sugar phosphate isomerase/epimerase [Caldilineaceae bacterium]
MPTVPIDVILPHLAALGFDAVEICVLPGFSTAITTLDNIERRRIADLLRRHKLTLSAVNYYVSMMEEDADRYAHNLSQIKAAIDLAVEWTLGDVPPVVVSGIGGKPGELETQQSRLVDRLNELGRYAEAQGITVALEHHVGNAAETPEQTIGLLSQVESPAIRVNFDISHFNVMGIPIAESVAKLLPYAAHTHIKDERGRAPNHAYLVPGEGEFDYVTYLKCMDAGGYTGVISVEISKMVQNRPDYDPLAVAAQSYAVVAKAFAEAEIRR